MRELGFLESRLLQLLTDAGGVMLTRELIAATHARPACVSASLRLLRDSGLVRRPHHGYWAAA